MQYIILLVSCATAVLSVPPPPPSNLSPHPRIVLTPSRIAEIQSAAAVNGSDASSFLALLETHATWALAQPVIPHGTPGPSGILIAVRESMDLLLTSAAAYVLLPPSANTDAYLARAIEELLNLCVTWPDWNTVQHALDTGEALAATGLAYDWLYNDLTTEQRGLVMNGIVTRGIQPYEKYIPDRFIFWWVNNTINWNCVCSSGGIISTLAIFGDANAPANVWTSVLQPLVEGVVPCVGSYHADGSWEEGPGYWGYASKYNIWMFSALQTALGDPSAAGLKDIAGVGGASLFTLYNTGANVLKGDGTAESFDWADAHVDEDWNPFISWWAAPQPWGFNVTAAAAWSVLGTTSFGALSINSNGAWAGFVEALAFYQPGGEVSEIVALPQYAYYNYTNVVIFRGAWDAPSAQQNYVGFKGGDTAWNHNHLDLGSFVFDYGGVRFAEDMGADSYDLPGYFDPVERWQYYRLNSLGHNVLVYGNVSQTVGSTATVIEFNSSGSGRAPAAAAAPTVDGYAIIDMTSAYVASAGVVSARRGIMSLSASSAIVIVDEILYHSTPLPSPPANLTWRLHTKAAPSVSPSDPALISLSRGAVAASLAILNHSTICPGYRGFVFTNVSTILPDPPYDSAAGYTRIDAFIDAPTAQGAACTNISVALGDPAIVQSLLIGDSHRVSPLHLWSTAGPLRLYNSIQDQ